MKITFIQTGGTIDKDYPEGQVNHGYDFKITDPAFTTILARAKPCFDIEIISALKKDSLDITDEDRENIYNIVTGVANDKVVVTHRTDTIHSTAKRLSQISGKTIVLTGAMLPEKFYASDADFNVGMAVAAVQTLSYGVYICLYGIVYKWEDFINK